MSDALDDIEIDLLLEAIFRLYHYDFRHYARASMKRRLLHARSQLVVQAAAWRRLSAAINELLKEVEQ